MNESPPMEASVRPRWRGAFSLESEHDKLSNLDFLRFVAASAIIISHSAEFMVTKPSRSLSHTQTAGLTLFVDVFFIISGFIIFFVYDSRISTLADFEEFIKRRLSRLLPLHLLTFLVMTTIFLTAIQFGVSINNPPNLSAKCVVSAVLLIHAFNSCGTTVPNSVSWSISAEIFVYLIFPIISILIHKSRIVRILSFGAIYFVLTAWAGGLDALSSGFTFYRAIPSFFMGAILFQERKVFMAQEWMKFIPIILILGLIAGSFLMISRGVLIVLAYAVVVFSVCLDTSDLKLQLVQKLAPLGQITYSMYMNHLIFITIIPNAIGDKILHLPQTQMIFVTVATWFVILLASVLSFNLFERPARRYLNRRFQFKDKGDRSNV